MSAQRPSMSANSERDSVLANDRVQDTLSREKQ